MLCNDEPWFPWMSKEDASYTNCGIAEIDDININKLEEDLFAELNKMIMMRSNAAEVDKEAEEAETEVHTMFALTAAAMKNARVK